MRSALTVQTENVAQKDGRIVMALLVPKGADKPYFDKDGVIWLKSGADKRKINSREEVWRLFQASGQLHADEQPTKAGIDKLDKLRFRDFLHDIHGLEYPDSPAELTRLLQNLNLAADNGQLNLAGLLLFAERPELIKPEFVVKAIRYPGNEIHVSEYNDTEDFTGPLQKIYENTLAFVMRNLHKVQAGRGVNAPGTPEIPQVVFEELLVNALVHRDYLVSAPIRLFIFNNRIEIISPGHLPNNLTVEKIRAGNSNLRNPTLVSYAAKNLLPYHGLGSGIRRAISSWSEIELRNDVEGCLFTAVVRRKPVDELRLETSLTTPEGRQNAEPPAKPRKRQRSLGRNTEKVLQACQKNPSITIQELAQLVGVSERSIERNIQKLQAFGRMERRGGKKHGYWHVPTPLSF